MDNVSDICPFGVVILIVIIIRARGVFMYVILRSSGAVPTEKNMHIYMKT